MVVIPSATPVITPVALMVAMAVLLLLHTPDAVASFTVKLLPAQTLKVAGAVTVIGSTTGKAFTVTMAVTMVVQLLLFVTV